jgi:hypothetical protein
VAQADLAVSAEPVEQGDLYVQHVHELVPKVANLLRHGIAQSRTASSPDAVAALVAASALTETVAVAVVADCLARNLSTGSGQSRRPAMLKVQVEARDGQQEADVTVSVFHRRPRWKLLP